MLKRLSAISITGVVVLCGWAYGQFGPGGAFTGQDLYLSGSKLTMHEIDPTEQILLFEGDFVMSVGWNRLTCDNAVVWLTTNRFDYRGNIQVEYSALVYLDGNVSYEQGKGARTSGISSIVVDRGDSLVTRFDVSGEVFATADQKLQAGEGDLRAAAVVQKAITAVSPVQNKPKIRAEAIVPEYPDAERPVYEPVETKKPWPLREMIRPAEITGPTEPRKKKDDKDEFDYPVNFSALWEPAPTPVSTTKEDGSRVTTIDGRFYCWQQQDEEGGMIEFQADTAVIFHGSNKLENEDSVSGGLLASGKVDAVYFKGNIVMTEGARTIKADEVYYDFQEKQALAVNAEARTFDAERGLPIYIRAKQLRQVSETIFEAEKITLTSSEFYVPQWSMNASRMVLTDTTNIDLREQGMTSKKSYDAILYDMDLRVGETTVFSWPKIRTNFERPDTAIRRIRFGGDSDMGMTFETRWHLARLLGKKEPEGVDSTFALDFFEERGMGAGADIEYEGDDYYGNVISYVMTDRGEDDLGRTQSRKNVDSGEDVRGRFRFQHRQYLPNDWQATIETSYASDKNFLEWMYRSEFNTGKEQETLVHLKRITDNWGFSILNKVRINDHATMTEELPTVEYHLKGQSFWDNRFTYYSDTQVSRFKDRLAADTAPPGSSERFYNYATTRHEVDMPFAWNTFKIVPFVAGSYSAEDGDGFDREMPGNRLTDGENSSWMSEVGVRVATMYWKSDQFVRSRFWDLNGIRHIVKPHFEAVRYHSRESESDMRDMINFGVSQRWQTRRGVKDKLRSLDWMRLDIDATFVKDTEAQTVAPYKYIYNDPSIPMVLRRNTSMFGVMRDSVNTDYMWRISDTMSVLSDMNYDIDAGRVQQANIGVVRYVYPNLSYYIGNRYLRPVVVNVPADGIYEEGSNALITAVTYSLNERYSATLSQEYNFDYGKSVRSDLTLLRRYHRLFYGLTLSVDESRDRSSVMFSVWPQGVKELALGSRKFVGITGPLIEE